MTRLELVSSGVIDLYDDIPMSLNLSIVDIEQPDKRTMTYSKTITLPGTSNNNNLFKHVYEIDSYSNYNPYVKAKVIMYEDEVNIFEGYLKLNNIITNESKIEYEVVLFADTSNFYLDMGDALLSDLDMSAYNHTYNETNIVNSWSATVGSGYVYPCIFYGEYEQYNTWTTEMFFPAIYVKTYLDKIFSSIGYTYESPFFNSDYFKRLIIPYSGGDLVLNDDQIKLTLFDTYGNGSGMANNVEYVANLTTITSDVSNQVNLGNDTIRIKYTGTYTFSIDVDASRITTPYTARTFTFRIVRYIPQTQGRQTLLLIDVEKTGNGRYTSTAVNCNAGDDIYIIVKVSGVLFPSYYCRIFNTYVNNSIKEGASMFLNNVMPRNIKQKDFVMSLIKMFNLFVDIDRNNSKKLIIEPRDDFYSSGTIVNWDAKVDYSKPIEIKPTTDYISKKYIYTYKQDKDYINNIYQQKYLEAFGTKNYYLDYDFLRGEKITEIIFSPTPLLFNKNSNRYYSMITADNPSIAYTKRQEFNIRILYYGGLKSTNQFKYKSKTYSTYPYAGYLDDPKTPYKDLCFFTSRDAYHFPTLYTNQNLFNFFHKRAIDEITNKFTRIVTAFIYLNPTDIVNLNFRNIYYFGGHYMRLLNIVDYSPNKSLFCKCEFLKIKDKDIPHSSTFTTSQPTFYGGVKATF